MDKFILNTVNNTISNDRPDVSFAITCDNPDNTAEIKVLEIDLQSLAEIVDWYEVVPAITNMGEPSPVGKVEKTGPKMGTITFTFGIATSFSTCGNRIEFTIANLQKKEGQTFPESAPISFKLRTRSAVIGTYPDDYRFNNILVSTKKPTIKSFKINPSITRESADINITYETIDATSCELKDKSGRIMHTHTNIDQTKPFRFTYPVHLGNPGSYPSPPFYLHAKDGGMEALDNTVANVITATTAEWTIMDNFSTLTATIDENGNVVYRMEQFKVIDLVLTEYQDMMWAIMQKRPVPDLPLDTQAYIWKSPDGASWLPHTISVKGDDEQFRNVPLPIPPELAHRPCVHFGNNSLYFVGGSKVDVSACSNIITVVNLANGGISSLEAPTAMKPRCMHAVVVYPDAVGNDNIWVIGGADKNGNGLNDVWRYNGEFWTAVPTGEAVFPKRCQFAATVQTDVYGQKSIWIGGGAVRYNGSTLNDLWVYKNSVWKKVRNSNGTADLNYSENWLTAASLCYLRTNKNSVPDPLTNSYNYIISSDISGEGKQLTCNWILGVDIERNYCKWVNIQINKPALSATFESARSFAAATIGFNGCVWTVIMAYISKGNIEVSKLYYSCPEI